MMPILKHTQRSPAQVNSVQFAVSVSGAVITVASGSFVIAKEALALTDSEEFTITSRPEDTDVHGYLVKDTDNAGEVRLLVDEVFSDDPEAYTFSRTGRFRLLYELFKVKVPPNTSSGEGLDLQVSEIVE
jgi:hypothetical protein